MHKIYIVPTTAPRQRTLQASAATWAAILPELKAADVRLGARIARFIERMPPTSPAETLSLSTEQAAVILRVAGVSA